MVIGFLNLVSVDAKERSFNSITDEYIRDLLECPVCIETIKSVPVYQCANGHVICNDCIEKLTNCPICRSDSALVRILKLEDIIQRLESIQPENGGTTTAKPNLQKWGMGSVRSYGTINGPNQAAPIGINLQANPGQATIMINNQDVRETMQAEQSEIRFLYRSIGRIILIWGFVGACLYFAIWLDLKYRANN